MISSTPKALHETTITCVGSYLMATKQEVSISNKLKSSWNYGAIPFSVEIEDQNHLARNEQPQNQELDTLSDMRVMK